MPFFKSLPENAGPPAVFTKFPGLYGLWSEMSQTMMNGPSPLSQGERELILAYAAIAAGCRYVYVAHSEVAYQWGIRRGLIEGQLHQRGGTGALQLGAQSLVALEEPRAEDGIKHGPAPRSWC